MTYTHKCKGTCSRAIELEIEDGIIKSCRIIGGCAGNTAGLAALVTGRDADEVERLLAGTPCGPRPTSCPDQLAQAIREAKASAPSPSAALPVPRGV